MFIHTTHSEGVWMAGTSIALTSNCTRTPATLWDQEWKLTSSPTCPTFPAIGSQSQFFGHVRRINRFCKFAQLLIRGLFFVLGL
jgi:hypothetical protein